jgi:hypothetical protein
MSAKQKNLVTLLLAAAAASGLIFYAHLGVVEPEEREAERKEVEEKVFAVHAPGERGPDGDPPAEPVFNSLSLEMRDTGMTMVVEQVRGTWRLTSPVGALADARAVEQLTRQLASTKFKGMVDENPTDEDLERYGLKPPRAILSVKAYVPDARGGGKDDPTRQRTVTLYAGIENSFDGSVYLRREGDPRVYSAPGMLRTALMKTPQEWRDKTVLALDEPSLRRIEVRTKKNAYTLERGDDEAWQMVRPVALRADAERVAQLMSSLKNERALAFPPPEQEHLVRQALEKPAVEARFVPASDEPVRLRLCEAQVNEVNSVYALVEKGSEVVLAEVNPHTLSLLDVGAQELKDKKALAFQLADVRQLILHPEPGGARIKLARAPDTQAWEVVEPQPARAREFKVASLLGSLQRLKAATFGELRPRRWEKYGITDASQGVTLLDVHGRQLARLWLGSEVKGNPPRLWARGSSDEVLEVEKSSLDDLRPSLSDVMVPTTSTP